MRAALLGLCLCLLACDGMTLFRRGDPPIGSGPILARVDGHGMTTSDLRERVLKMEPRFDTLEEKERRSTIDQVLRLEVLYRAAEKRGLLEDPEVRETLRRVLVQRLLQNELDSVVKPADVTDEELRAHYDAHRSDYNQPARARFLWFVGDKKEQAQEAAELLAQKNITTLKGVSGNQASSLGFDDASFMTEQELTERLGEPAAVLWKAPELGGPTEVVETEVGWVVAKLTGRKNDVSRPFEQVRDTIRQRLFRERRTAAFEDLVRKHRESLGVWVDSDIAQRLVAPPTKESSP